MKRHEAAAADALSAFNELPNQYDFLVEGRKAFAEHLDALEAAGTDPREAMCFVWMTSSAEDENGASP